MLLLNSHKYQQENEILPFMINNRSKHFYYTTEIHTPSFQQITIDDNSIIEHTELPCNRAYTISHIVSLIRRI